MVAKTLYHPTAFMRYVRRDKAAPCMVLQQWWTPSLSDVFQCIPPETKGRGGEWRDVPISIEQPIVKVPQ